MIHKLFSLLLLSSLISCTETEIKSVETPQPIERDLTEYIYTGAPKEEGHSMLDSALQIKADDMLSRALNDEGIPEDLFEKLSDPTFNLRAIVDSLPDGPQKELLLKNFAMAEEILKSLQDGKTPEEIIASKSK
jgi:hypothetical protein